MFIHMSVPSDFYWKDYLRLNKDLKYDNEQGAIQHYLQFGIKENRPYKGYANETARDIKLYNGLPYDFEWREYLSLNPDLPFTNEKETINHYIKNGSKEGRSYKITHSIQLPEDFNWKEYILINHDLKHLTEQKAAENHYLTYGKNENRIYKHSNSYNSKVNFENKDENLLHKKKNDEQMNDFHNYIYKHFGIVLYNDFNYCLRDKHKYLLSKYNITDINCKYILNHVMNTNYSIKNRNDGFELCISLYNEKNIFRICELLLVLSQNIQNKNIKSIHILFENYNDANNLLKETLDLLIVGQKLSSFIKITSIYERPCFQYIFDYVNNFKGKFIVSNSDIIFDNTLENILDLKHNDFLCISRKNWNCFKNKWEVITLSLGPTDPKTYLNYFSHDAWIFHAPLAHSIKIDYLLGDMFCDSYLDYKLSKNSFDCYNLANDVNCLHVQNGFSASQEVATNQDVYHKALAKLQSKEPDVPQLIYALDNTSLHDYKTSHKQHRNKFYSHPEYLDKIRNDTNYQV